MYRETLHQDVANLIEACLAQQGFELVELQMQQQRGRCLIRLYVDTDDGVSLEDCQKLSFDIGQILDDADIMPNAYVLEVSSPGLDRPLRTVRDFQRQCNRLVRVFLHTPLLGKMQYIGRIITVTQDDLLLHIAPNVPLSLSFSQINHGVIELEFK